MAIKKEGGIYINRSETLKITGTHLLPAISKLYGLDGYELNAINAHEGGRNLVYDCVKAGAEAKILRITFWRDRSREDLLAETEYIRYLHTKGGSVANVIDSLHGNLFEEIAHDGHTYFATLFEKAKGSRLPDNNYRYRDGAPITEYWYNCGKTLGKLHQLSKEYTPIYKRFSFFDKFNAAYVDKLIPDSLPLLKNKMFDLYKNLEGLDKSRENFGMVHFDFNDGNYSIDYDTGQITVYDFDESCNCWYLFDLTSLWDNGTGWISHEKSVAKRRKFMEDYFKIVLDGYRSETAVADYMLDMLPFFHQVQLMGGIIDMYEHTRNTGETVHAEWTSDAIKCLEEDILYNGFFQES